MSSGPLSLTLPSAFDPWLTDRHSEKERDRDRHTEREFKNLQKNKTSSLRVVISLLFLMFKPISNYLQIIPRQVQLICRSQEPGASPQHPFSFQLVQTAVPGLPVRTESGTERVHPTGVPKDFLMPSCHHTAGTQHSSMDSAGRTPSPHPQSCLNSSFRSVPPFPPPSLFSPPGIK